MGVIRLYAEILKDYPEIVHKKIAQIDHLYIDFNAIVYNTFIILGKKDNGFELIDDIVKSLITIIENLNPLKSVYIAVDGPAPAAKMIQQRDRRYKSLLEKKIINEISIKYGIQKENNNNNNWTSAYISPGTKFMSELENKISESLKLFSEKYDSLKIIFDTCNIPGEGEHKIIQSIKNSVPKNNSEDTYVVHSPDNDLIVLLSMIKASVYLIRNEEQELSNPFVFVDIQQFMSILYNEYGEKDSENTEKELKKQKFAEDYAFLTFFFGNDFIKAVPYLKIKERNTNLLFTIYQDIQLELNDYIVNENVINTQFLEKLLNKIAEHELSLLQSMQRKRHFITKNSAIKAQEREKDQLQKDKKELLETEIKNFEHTAFYDHVNPFHERYNYLFSKIDYYNENYISMYNDYFFRGHDLKKVYNDYIMSFQYVLNYYNGKIDQRYYYKYRAAPLFIGFKEFNFNDLKLNSFDFTTKPVSQYEQLLLILPKQLFYVIPNNHIINNIPKELLKKYRDVYSLSLDVVQGTKYIYSSLIMPDLPIQEVIEYISKIKN